jgi:hypothetical protein
VIAVCGLAIVVALLPSKARSQLGLDPCCAMMSVGLNTISGLLRNVVAQPLGSIQQNQQQSANYEQQVVFPMAAITQARNMAVQFQSPYRARPCVLRNCSNKACSQAIRAQCHKSQATTPLCTGT